MGFHLGISAPGYEGKLDCYFHIDKAFFWFVETYLIYQEESVLKKIGEAYAIDLTPYTRFVYTNGPELPQEEIEKSLQDTDSVINTTQEFINAVNNNPFAITTINYTSYDKIMPIERETMKAWKSEFGSRVANEYKKHWAEKVRNQEKNPYPWNTYFTSKEIVQHLEAVLKSLRCFKNKGENKVYFYAG